MGRETNKTQSLCLEDTDCLLSPAGPHRAKMETMIHLSGEQGQVEFPQGSPLCLHLAVGRSSVLWWDRGARATDTNPRPNIWIGQGRAELASGVTPTPTLGLHIGGGASSKYPGWIQHLPRPVNEHIKALKSWLAGTVA